MTTTTAASIWAPQWTASIGPSTAAPRGAAPIVSRRQPYAVRHYAVIPSAGTVSVAGQRLARSGLQVTKSSARHSASSAEAGRDCTSSALA